jgi:hypothetical protein
MKKSLHSLFRALTAGRRPARPARRAHLQVENLEARDQPAAGWALTSTVVDPNHLLDAQGHVKNGDQRVTIQINSATDNTVGFLNTFDNGTVVNDYQFDFMAGNLPQSLVGGGTLSTQVNGSYTEVVKGDLHPGFTERFLVGAQGEGTAKTIADGLQQDGVLGVGQVGGGIIHRAQVQQTFTVPTPTMAAGQETFVLDLSIGGIGSMARLTYTNTADSVVPPPAPRPTPSPTGTTPTAPAGSSLVSGLVAVQQKLLRKTQQVLSRRRLPPNFVRNGREFAAGILKVANDLMATADLNGDPQLKALGQKLLDLDGQLNAQFDKIQARQGKKGKHGGSLAFLLPNARDVVDLERAGVSTLETVQMLAKSD